MRYFFFFLARFFFFFVRSTVDACLNDQTPLCQLPWNNNGLRFQSNLLFFSFGFWFSVFGGVFFFFDVPRFFWKLSREGSQLFVSSDQTPF